MLDHLPQWLRLRGLRQRDLARALAVSDATVSNWIRGNQSMSVAQLRRIAAFLGATESDLLVDPAECALPAKVEQTLKLMDSLGPDQWDAVLTMARALDAAKRR